MAQLFSRPLPPPTTPADGRRVAAQIALLLIGAEVLVLIHYVTNVGTARLGVQIGRLVITCLLCFALYRGFRWAWWVLVVLVVIATLAAAAMTLVFVTRDSAVGAALMGSLFAVYLVAAYRMVWSDQLRNYIDEQ